eukprot:3950504-Prymnesium_polylepis.1
MSLARGPCIITGGLGGLGLRAATLLVASGTTLLLLVSRSGHVARKAQGLELRLQSLHSAASVVACDNADSSNVGAVLSMQPPTCVLHAGGVSDKGLLVELFAHSLRWLHAAKALGASHLKSSSASVPLEAR